MNNEVYKIIGVIDAKTFYGKGISVVRFDSSKALISQIQDAIAKTGYKVTGHNIISN